MGALINGEYDDVVEKHVIVDARYPYEFESGHIQVSDTPVQYIIWNAIVVLYSF